MATSRSSISNARAPTHRVTARPASSSLKTHRRSLLCRAEDTQTSGTFSFIMCCFILYCVFFYAQLVFVLFLFLFCFVFLLGFVLLFVVRSSSRSCKVHPSNNNNNQADNPFFLTHTHTHTHLPLLSIVNTHTHTHTHLCSPLLLSSLLLIYGIRSGERGDGRNVRGTGVEEPGARARRLLGALVRAVPHDCAAH